MKADILAFYHYNALDNLVKNVTNSKIVHLAIRLDDKYMIESTTRGVHISKICNKYNYYNLRYQELTAKERDDIIKFAKNKIGKEFDYNTYITIGLYKLFGFANTWNNPNKYTCTELVIDAYKSIGIDLTNGMKENNVSPGDIANNTKLTVTSKIIQAPL